MTCTFLIYIMHYVNKNSGCAGTGIEAICRRHTSDRFHHGIPACGDSAARKDACKQTTGSRYMLAFPHRLGRPCPPEQIKKAVVLRQPYKRTGKYSVIYLLYLSSSLNYILSR